MEKSCRECGASFEATANQVKKGDYRCQVCARKYNKAYRAQNAASARAYRKKRRTDPAFLSAETVRRARSYAKRRDAPEYKNRRAEQARARVKNPVERPKHEARWAAYRAIRAGTIEREPCQICGTTNRVEAHHDDYSKPLEVRWLCRAHHREFHTRQRRITL